MQTHTQNFLDSGSKFTGRVRRTRDEPFSINWLEVTCLSDFGYLESLRRYSRSKSDVVQNRPKFCIFLAPKIFRVGPSEFLDLHYKIGADTDYVAKFHGDRPTELGDLVAK